MSWECRQEVKLKLCNVCVLFPVICITMFCGVRQLFELVCQLPGQLSQQGQRSVCPWHTHTQTHMSACTHTQTCSSNILASFCFHTQVCRKKTGSLIKHMHTCTYTHIQTQSWFSFSWQFDCLAAVKRLNQRSSVCKKMNRSIAESNSESSWVWFIL